MGTLISILVAFGFHIIDFASGLVWAIKNKCVTSSKMRDGLFKKMGFVFCYMVALLLDKYGGLIGFTVGVKILPSIILYAVSTEFVSIVENVAKINPDLVPEKLLSIFHIDKQIGEKKDEKDLP